LNLSGSKFADVLLYVRPCSEAV